MFAWFPFKHETVKLPQEKNVTFRKLNSSFPAITQVKTNVVSTIGSIPIVINLPRRDRMRVESRVNCCFVVVVAREMLIETTEAKRNTKFAFGHCHFVNKKTTATSKNQLPAAGKMCLLCYLAG